MAKPLNTKLILRVIGLNLLVIGVALLFCIAIALIYHEGVFPFLVSGAISLGIGILVFSTTSRVRKSQDLNRKDAYIIVTLSWVMMGFVGALPYILSHSIPSFTNALFESVSGFTTTGSSILTDIESLPKSILFWRSLTHWIGGIGIIILVIVILPSLHVGGYHLFTLESSLQDKIQPRIKQVGFRLLIIYVSLTALQTVFLLLGHMNLYESVCHAFGTVATGGFSPKNDSITSYSPYIQYVIMIFMMLSGTNFVIHYYLLKREFSKIRRNEEFKFYYALTFIIGGILTATLMVHLNRPFEEAFRESFFQVISIITTTGFASSDYLFWPGFAWIIIFFTMFLGGSTGSTSGGIKMVRHLILYKNLGNTLKRIIHPSAVLPVRLNGESLSTDFNNSNFSFFFTYLFVFIVTTIVLVALGTDARTAGSSVATCMAGIGPGIGTIGPSANFAHLPQAGKLILTFIMILGRLEINTVIILFTRNYWKS